MKIERTSRDRSGGIGLPLKDDKRGPSRSVGGSFDKAVQTVEIEALLKELDDIGSKLSRVPSRVVLARYRELVKQLLDQALKGFLLRRDLRWRRTERRAFVVVEQTEEWLQELEDVLLRENQRTKALKLMEDIKGCLISLLF
ncbi:DUF327 family protein [Dethiosulfovibrio salsuginis]|uniref:DUF327 domain-containing protein n=1 Tax=Dethiosulfovibrio salsuginis TaxID=561720 RepID=A0A1X7I822_9BACT|nr:DUF327 family protein [Dethiosulfovibrio salsuginis]SMG10758.1 hypothetical protein SAMN06275492_101219 [Dethiosulfovibrio salsuginis]